MQRLYLGPMPTFSLARHREDHGPMTNSTPIETKPSEPEGEDQDRSA